MLAAEHGGFLLPFKQTRRAISPHDLSQFVSGERRDAMIMGGVVLDREPTISSGQDGGFLFVSSFSSEGERMIFSTLYLLCFSVLTRFGKWLKASLGRCFGFLIKRTSGVGAEDVLEEDAPEREFFPLPLLMFPMELFAYIEAGDVLEEEPSPLLFLILLILILSMQESIYNESGTVIEAEVLEEDVPEKKVSPIIRLYNWVKTYPRAFWFLMLGYGINGLASFVGTYLILLLTNERGFKPAMAGLMSGLVGTGSVVSSLLFSWISDRYGRRRTMSWAMLFAALVTWVLGFVSPLFLVAPLAFLQGALTNSYGTTIRAYLSDIIPDTQMRGQAGQLTYWAFNIGIGLAPALIALVAFVSNSYSALFVADGATTLLVLMLIRAGVPEVPHSYTPPVQQGAKRQNFIANALAPFAIWKNRKLAAFVLISAIKDVVYYQYQATLPLTMQTDKLGKVLIGVVIGLNGLIVIALGWLPAPKGWSAQKILALSSTLIGGGLFLALFASWVVNIELRVAVFVAAILVMTIGEIFSEVGESQAVAEMSGADASSSGMYQGAARLHLYIGMGAGPFLGPLVYQIFGPLVLWPLCLIFGLVAGYGFLWMETGSAVGVLHLIWRETISSLWQHRFKVSIMFNVILLVLLISNSFTRTVHMPASPVLRLRSGQQVDCTRGPVTLVLKEGGKDLLCYYADSPIVIHAANVDFDQLCIRGFGVFANYDSKYDPSSPLFDGSQELRFQAQLYAQKGCSSVTAVGLNQLAGAVDLRVVFPQPQSPLTKVPEVFPTEDIDNVTGICADHSDFISLSLLGNKQLCAANSGTLHISPIQMDTLCTGKNRAEDGFVDPSNQNNYTLFVAYRFNACIGIPPMRVNWVHIFGLFEGLSDR